MSVVVGWRHSVENMDNQNGVWASFFKNGYCEWASGIKSNWFLKVLVRGRVVARFARTAQQSWLTGGGGPGA